MTEGIERTLIGADPGRLSYCAELVRERGNHAITKLPARSTKRYFPPGRDFVAWSVRDKLVKANLDLTEELLEEVPADLDLA